MVLLNLSPGIRVGSDLDYSPFRVNHKKKQGPEVSCDMNLHLYWWRTYSYKSFLLPAHPNHSIALVSSIFSLYLKALNIALAMQAVDYDDSACAREFWLGLLYEAEPSADKVILFQ